MKIGIITLTNGTNYGNRLQMYAIEQFLIKLGHDPEIILNKSYIHGVEYHLKKAIKILIGYKDERQKYKRKRSFDKFDKLFIKFGTISLDENYDQSSLGYKYDAFICGSDQIWNPKFPYINGGCFADFPGARLRISYAASFGEPRIPDKQVAQFREWLDGMDAISVRENSGIQIVSDLIHKKAELVIDPTMLLDKKQWNEIEQKPDIPIIEPYILVYFLGEKSNDIIQFISLLKEEKHLEIVDIFPHVGEKNYYLNPSHFIYLIHHAEIVVTDSFHASVFSVLYNKPLRLFDRISLKHDMSSRIDTFVQMFNCEWVRNNYSINYECDLQFNVDSILKKERLKAEEYLTRALSYLRK